MHTRRKSAGRGQSVRAQADIHAIGKGVEQPELNSTATETQLPALAVRVVAGRFRLNVSLAAVVCELAGLGEIGGAA